MVRLPSAQVLRHYSAPGTARWDLGPES